MSKRTCYSIIGLALLLVVFSCGTTKKIEALKPIPSSQTPLVYSNKISLITMPMEVSLKEIERQLNKTCRV